jgi:hypothetical protein
MKKSVFAILVVSLFYFGCEKDFDTVVDQSAVAYQVTEVDTIGSIRYNQLDSLIRISVSINDPSNLLNIFVDIYSPTGSKLNQNEFNLLDNGLLSNGDTIKGDHSFANKFPFSRQHPIGLYSVKYFARDNYNRTDLVAIQNFHYSNGQDSIPPVISNLIIPDSVIRGASFIFNLLVTDLNGLSDIDTVYFELFRPDNSQVFPSAGVTKFVMHDDGNLNVFGDHTAGDGIFSFKNSFGTSAQIGEWKFVFQARDRGGKYSNTLTHLMQVQ